MQTDFRLESAHTVSRVLHDGLAVLEIRDAGVLNVLSSPVAEDVTSAIQQLACRNDVRVLVFRGSGDRAFIGGADIKEMALLQPHSARDFIKRIAALCEVLRNFPAPVVVRLPGWCLGAGLEVAAACDIRVGSCDAHFGMPEVAVGIPSVVHGALLPRLIGHARARWLMLTAQNVDAPTAFSWGLLDQVCELKDLDATVDATARRFLELGASAVRQQKRLLRSWEEASLEDAVEESIEEFAAAFASGEPQRLMGEFVNRKRAI